MNGAREKLPEVKVQRAAAKRKRYDPIKARNEQLLVKYGLTNEQWDAFFERQGRRCAICQSDTPRSKRGWSTDHDHQTGKLREILCAVCNVAVGYLERMDSRFYDYLKRHAEH